MRAAKLEPAYRDGLQHPARLIGPLLSCRSRGICL